MCASGLDTEDKGCLLSSTHHFSGILDWQQLLWTVTSCYRVVLCFNLADFNIHKLWTIFLPATCFSWFGILTDKKEKG